MPDAEPGRWGDKTVAGFLDIARSSYVNLPLGLRQRVGAALAAVPFNLRYGSTYRACRAEIAQARQDPRMARTEQQRRLLKVVATALERSPYYQQAFAAVFGPNARADDIVQPQNWARVPTLDNLTVRREAERLCCVPQNRLDRVATGGSSGHPLPFFLDRDRSPKEYAFILDLWEQAGCGPDDWRASFRGWHIPANSRLPFEIEPALRQLRVSVFRMEADPMADYAQEIARRGIKFFQGYPHAIARFATFVLREDLPMRHDITGIMLHSEPFYPEYRTAITQAFPNAVLLPFYGLSEKCAFGSPLPGREGVYAMNPLYGLTELLDNQGVPVTEPGRQGRIVSTGLQFLGMPFIRYETGDRATLVELPDEANSHSLLVANITPREGHLFLISRSNVPIVAHMAIMGDREVEAIAAFQYEQHRPGDVLMRVELAPGASPAMFAAYIRKANERQRGELVFTPEIVPSIPLTARGKRRIVIQHLPIPRSTERSPLPAPSHGDIDA
jgi:phenylacetate-CoA ligase